MPDGRWPGAAERALGSPLGNAALQNAQRIGWAFCILDPAARDQRAPLKLGTCASGLMNHPAADGTAYATFCVLQDRLDIQ